MTASEYVWVITTHTGYGEGADVMGVYASPERARAALEAEPNVRVTEKGGQVCGEPIDEKRYPRIWAVAEKYQIER